ncbi:hypothetical protein [Marinifilum fragile]|jgi:hypothetical protein|uniref:hypothetical protein n=1 Tax=Marinifilum fragile TaxID=570161 RepID=UPI002AA7E32F|nr:hypothetical protein [Marinifilum fragile]
MKKLLFVAIAALSVLVSCNQTNKKRDTKQEEIEPVAAKTISQVMEIAAQNVGKEVFFQGMVQHVCAHSGRRAILLDETGKLSIRVEAKGEINGFNRELSGSTIAVKGTIAEQRLSEETINEYEAKVKAKQDAEEGGKHCAAEMTNITKMRDWMKENNKKFYSIYFINGTSYEIVE